jgi:ribose transport system substrate-binding protein
MKTRFRTMSALALALMVAILVAITGCGSSSSSDSTGGGETSAGGSSSPGVERATEAVSAYEQPPTEIGVTEALKEVPTDGTIAFLESSVPAAQQLGDAMEEAAAAMGVKFERISAGLSPQTIQKAWGQVIANPPDAVLEGGFPISLMTVPLEKMKELEVPVLTLYSEESPLTTTVVGTPQFETTGEILANFVTAQSEGDANTLYVTNSDVPGLAPQREFMEKEYAKNCAGCKIDAIEIPLDGIGRTIPGEVVSYLQQNPDTNWIVFGTPEFATGVPQAVKAAGIDSVTAVTQSETPLVFEYIKNEELVEATYGISLEFTAWKTIDSAAREITGQPVPAADPSPAQFLFAKDMTFDISKPWPSVENYKQKFEELWGV